MQVDLIPGYRIKRKLGHGAFAQVYLAVQRSLDREIALKVMNPSMSTDQDLCERFIAEARVVASLRHRSIVSIHDVGKHEDNYYISMDLVGGSTLAEGIRHKQLPAPALTVIRQIGEALGCAHERGIVHRDVKPGNILFDSDGTAILTDFGIAKNLASDEQRTVVGSIIGTAAYMSPEQVSAQSDIDGRSDLYSLGIVLYEMLAGAPPFRGKDHFTTALMHLSQPVPRLAAEHRQYQKLLDRMLAKERDDRFASANELVRFIDKSSGMSGTPTKDDPSDTATMLHTGAGSTRVIPDVKHAESAPQRQASDPPKRDRRRVTADDSASNRSRGPARTTPEKSALRLPLFIGAGVSVVAAVIVLGILGQDRFIAGPDRPPETLPTPPEASPDTSPGSGGLSSGNDEATPIDPRPVPSQPLDEATQLRVDNLLNAAKLNELVGRILEPPGANAIEAYQDVLALDPGNASANEALDRLNPR